MKGEYYVFSKEIFKKVMDYWCRNNLSDWRTKWCIALAVMLIVFIAILFTEAVIRYAFKDMYKSCFRFNTYAGVFLGIFIPLIYICSYVYNYNCYMEYEIIMPVIEQGKYVDGMKLIEEYCLETFMPDVVEDIHDDYIYQYADECKANGEYIDAFVYYVTVIEFKDSREKALELISDVKGELENE